MVEAVRVATARLGVPTFDFVMAPHWHDPPFYQLSCTQPATRQLALAIDTALSEQNVEYRSRRKSLRLGMLRIRQVDPQAIATMDRHLQAARGSSNEQHKHSCLLTELGQDDEMLHYAADPPTPLDPSTSPHF